MLIEKIYYRVLQFFWNISVPFYVRYKGVKLGKNVKFYGFPIISLHPKSKVVIGDNVVICSDSRFTALGVNHKTILRTLENNVEIYIGNDCGLSGTTICSAKSIMIGNSCLIGANVSIFDTDFHPINPDNRRYSKDKNQIAKSPVMICENVFLGSNCMVLKGTKIGENSVIGACSNVLQDVPKNEVWAGIPAKRISSIFERFLD